MISEVIQEGVLLVLVISGVPLLLCCFNGLLVALLQSVTQIQEQSIGFVTKLATVVIVLAIGGRWGLENLESYLQKLLNLIAVLG